MVICNQCAAACLDEKEVEHLRKCIQLDLECAAICRAAVEVMSLGGRLSAEICACCADSCTACADECDKHAAMGMDHCRACADACRACAAACLEMVAA